jgi:hypothetical protein
MRIKLAFGALLAAATLVSADRGFAQEHVIAPELVQQRMVDAAAQRDTDLATVRLAFSSPEAVRAAGALRVDLASVQSRLGTLNDGELHELATRAAALDSDPVAGALTRRQLWIGLIALAVILVVIIVA